MQTHCRYITHTVDTNITHCRYITHTADTNTLQILTTHVAPSAEYPQSPAHHPWQCSAAATAAAPLSLISCGCVTYNSRRAAPIVAPSSQLTLYLISVTKLSHCSGQQTRATWRWSPDTCDNSSRLFCFEKLL